MHAHTPTRDAIEVRLCIGSSIAGANVGIADLVLETSLDGVTYTPLTSITSGGGVLQCPSPWVYNANADVSAITAGAVGACIAPSGPGCHSVFFNPSVQYKYVRGLVQGVQFGSVCAFGPNARSTSLNGNYVDGVSITTTPNNERQNQNARNHIWTLAAGVTDHVNPDAPLLGCGCPCTNFGSTTFSTMKKFLGSQELLTESFYCSTGYHGTTVPAAAWLTADALWDKMGALQGPDFGGEGFTECAALEGDFICGTPSGTASPTSSPSGTASPTPTPTSSSSTGAVASSTPSPTSTPTQTPTATPTASRTSSPSPVPIAAGPVTNNSTGTLSGDSATVGTTTGQETEPVKPAGGDNVVTPSSDSKSGWSASKTALTAGVVIGCVAGVVALTQLYRKSRRGTLTGRTNTVRPDQAAPANPGRVSTVFIDGGIVLGQPQTV